MAKKKLSVMDFIVELWDDGSGEFKECIIRVYGKFDKQFAKGWLTANVLRDSNSVHESICEAGRTRDYQRYIAEECEAFVDGIRE